MEDYKPAKLGQAGHGNFRREYEEDLNNELFGYEGSSGLPKTPGKQLGQQNDEISPDLNAQITSDESLGKQKQRYEDDKSLNKSAADRTFQEELDKSRKSS